jgi:uncharacterized membrane protein YfcA
MTDPKFSTCPSASCSSLLSVTLFGLAISPNYTLSDQIDWRLADLVMFGGMLEAVASRRLATRAAMARRILRRRDRHARG